MVSRSKSREAREPRGRRTGPRSGPRRRGTCVARPNAMTRKCPNSRPSRTASVLLFVADDLDAELHVFLIAAGDMQTVWFPVPVAAFFRRIVNVVSTLSISHHYLSQSRSEPAAHPPLRWPAWLARTAKFDTQCFQRILHVDSHTAYTDLPVHTADIKDPPPPNCTFFSGSRPLDQIHQLIENPALYDPVRKPRYPIVLCHGAYYMQSC